MDSPVAPEVLAAAVVPAGHDAERADPDPGGRDVERVGWDRAIMTRTVSTTTRQAATASTRPSSGVRRPPDVTCMPRPPSGGMLPGGQAPELIIPAPTVTPVASSMRMNEPVVRFLL